MEASASRSFQDRLSLSTSRALTFLHRHHLRIIAGAVLIAWVVGLILSWSSAPLLIAMIALTPVAVGSLVLVAQASRLTTWINASENRLAEIKGRYARNNGRISRYVVTPVSGGSLWLWQKTSGVENDHLRASVRATAFTFVSSVVTITVAIVGLIILWIVVALAIFAFAISMVLKAMSDDNSSSPGRSLFATACRKCGSKEHVTGRCPHGFFSNQCEKCGASNHATAQCPHGFFSSKCARCDSVDHSTADCPHGIFSSECGSCGSRNHATSNCPHGMFTSQCSNCGSVDHATRQCPH